MGRDHVGRNIYGRHLAKSSKFLNNPIDNRVDVLRRMYSRVLTELAMNRFTWTNVPESIDVRYLEMELTRGGLVVWYYDEDYNKYFALRASGSGNVNMYDNPQHFTVYGNAMINKRLSVKQCVPIWSNFTRTQDLDIIYIYADRLAEIDRTIEINSKSARRAKILVADQNTQLSATNINRAIDTGQSVIQVRGTMGDISQTIKALDLGVEPDSLEKLHILRTRIWNECMGLLGIDNANQDKKERLVADEVDANSDQVELSRAVNLKSRKLAADQINAMSRFLNGQEMIIDGVEVTMPDWPELNIGVEYNNQEPAMPAAPDETEEGDDSGTVHDEA